MRISYDCSSMYVCHVSRCDCERYSINTSVQIRGDGYR